MPFTPTTANLQTLKNELLTDPNAYGYAALITAGNHQGLADMVNLPRVGITVRRGIRTGIDVMNCIDGAEFVALSAGARDYLIALVTPVEGADLSNDVVRAALGAAFVEGSATRPRLLAIADKTPASRAEFGWGVDTLITAAHIASALNLP